MDFQYFNTKISKMLQFISSFINNYNRYLKYFPGTKLTSAFTICLLLFLNGCSSGNADKKLLDYKSELNTLYKEFGGSTDMPDVEFFLFGMGNRPKFIYKKGILKNLFTAEVAGSWDVADCIILPPEYTVELTLSNGTKVIISEDEYGIWINENGKKYPIEGSTTPVILPDFKQYRYERILKVLHHEILINILNGKPLPNLLVYKNPWRRDGAMMAMCLSFTGNINLIKDWVLSLTDPYDRNNAGETEADNLGQTLYLLSFFSDKCSPLAQNILNEVKRFEVTSDEGKFIKGRSDFHETPVYQTKWLKFGLKSLYLPDDYIIPAVKDDYSALFWWDYTDNYYPGKPDADDRGNYPYLGWACDHFHKTKKSTLSNRIYPLTWEINASQADYSKMTAVDSIYFAGKNASPHTWHASEAFLYLLEFRK